MRRSRLKNIINKSKGISIKQQLIGETPFEHFKNSLPEELDSFKGDNYRLEAAWKAYGSPKNYEEAVWLGLCNPMIPDKMPSIGYNEETDEYEYLNSGKENDLVAKDIRVWDNDVIPLVKELKLGGYVRTFNEEKNCWTYSKNPQERIESPENNEQQVIEEFKQGGQMNVIPEGALHARKNNMDLAKEGEVTHKGIPVVDNNGEQQAEIERQEIIFTKDTTDKIECFYKNFKDDSKTSAEKDELAIKCGKFLVKQILENTDDKAGLIEEVKQNI